MSQVRIVVLLIVGMAFSQVSYGQSKKKDDLKKHMPTENIDMWKEANRKANQPKRKKIDYLYKKYDYGVLYGNPCAMEATRKMGFEYVMQPYFGNGEVYNNIWVNIKLVFTKSPFWKLILNHRINECREKSGDIVG